MRSLNARIIFALLAVLGYLGGYLHALRDVAQKSGAEPLVLLGGSLTTAIGCALLCGAATAAVAITPGGAARVKAPTPLGECAAAALFFTVGSAGLRAALWAVG